MSKRQLVVTSTTFTAEYLTCSHVHAHIKTQLFALNTRKRRTCAGAALAPGSGDVPLPPGAAGGDSVPFVIIQSWL